MQSLERKMAVADVVAIVLLHDGVVEEAELAAVQEMDRDDRGLASEVQDAIARWRPRQSEIAETAGLQTAIGGVAARLTSDQKAILHRALVPSMSEELERAVREALGVGAG